MNRYWGRLFIVMGILLLSTKLNAVRVKDLYKASIPVSSQSLQEREKALPTALAQVLIKVSGNSNVADNAVIKNRLNNANQLIQEFGYSTLKSSMPYMLEIQFDEEGVKKILRESAMPTWAANRPAALVWIASEAPERDVEIVSQGDQNEVGQLIKQRAQQRGMPLQFPLLDAADMHHINANDIVTMTIPSIQEATKRYANPAFMMMRIVQMSDGCFAQAKLVLDRDQWDWNRSGKSLAEVINPIMDDMADKMASRYATVVTNSVQGQWQLTVNGIHQHHDFSHLMKYIAHLPPVASVQVTKIMGDHVILNVRVRATRESFMQILAAGNKLTAMPTEDQQLVYQWGG